MLRASGADALACWPRLRRQRTIVETLTLMHSPTTLFLCYFRPGLRDTLATIFQTLAGSFCRCHRAGQHDFHHEKEEEEINLSMTRGEEWSLYRMSREDG